MAGGVTCYGNASPDDTHLLANVVAVDDDIVGWLEHRQRRSEIKRSAEIDRHMPRPKSRVAKSPPNGQDVYP
jgi:hypothetical protein